MRAVKPPQRPDLPKQRIQRWRAGKVRPIPGNSPHDPGRLTRGYFLIVKESLRRCLSRHLWPTGLRNNTRRLICVFKAWRNLSGPMWFQNQNQTLGWGRAASRWSAPSPGSRTCREDHAPSHRPQMSSGRLFLDRVARQHCPSPLHRHGQINTHSSEGLARGDISTLLGRVTFLLCVDTIP
jgi:hypothetical protein